MAPISIAKTLSEQTDNNIVELKVSGKLTAEDYAVITPEVEQRMEKYDKIRLCIELHDFHGWTAGAMWEDLKFDFRHFNDIERIAVVGEDRWEKGMTMFFKPFTAATVRYFDNHRLEEAQNWIREL